MVKSPFQDLRISGLHLERCHVANHPIIRIYLKLSDRPPLGWAYIFTTVWNSAEYDLKPPAGVEDGALWIECALEELRQFHLPQLEEAIAQANATYRVTQRQKAVDLRSQKQLDDQTHALLKELETSLNPTANVTPAPDRERKSITQNLMKGLRKMFVPRPK
jgi:hypothetical protein